MSIAPLPCFNAPYAPDDGDLAARLLADAPLAPEREARIDVTATRLIEAIRAHDHGLGGIEQVLAEFALSTKEGLALMVLAEALLRVPDALTADRFIEDKLGQGDFEHHATRSGALLVNASAWALGISARLVQPSETPQGVLAALTKRLGAPAVRAATRAAMRLMGNHFVLGETIAAALAAGAARGRRASALFVRYAGRRRAHRQPMRSATSRPMRRRSTPSAATPAMRRCRRGPASRSNSRRCIRASRRSAATG